jgi:hypothetical protein
LYLALPTHKRAAYACSVSERLSLKYQVKQILF